MTDILLILIIIIGIINIILLFFRTKKTEDFNTKNLEELLSKDILRLENQIKDDFSRNRTEFNDNSKGSREEVSNLFREFSNNMIDRISENLNSQKNQLEIFSN